MPLLEIHRTVAAGNSRLAERDQVECLMGNPPSWMLRYGISMIGGIFLLFLLMSYLLQYPDIVEAKVTLTTAHPPIRVIAQTGGRVAELFVSEGQPVVEGQLLAVLENPARWQDVLALEDWLTAGGQSAALRAGLQMGGLQNEYSLFCEHSKDYQYYDKNNHSRIKREELRKQIDNLNAINNNLEKQKKIVEQELTLAAKERSRQQQLLTARVIAEKEFEAAEMTWLRQQRQMESIEASGIQNTLQVHQLETQIIDLNHAYDENQMARERVLYEDKERLKSAISAWKLQYLVTAPISGKIALSKIWSPRQTVNGGEELLAVIPNGAETGQESVVLGKAVLPMANSGKVRTGMRAVIFLDGFPPQEYGTINAVVANVSALPQENAYKVDMQLPDAVKTAGLKPIVFRQEMTGQAKIITENRRVLDRIFGKLYDLCSG